MSGRKPKADELELWRQVAQKVTPRPKANTATFVPRDSKTKRAASEKTAPSSTRMPSTLKLSGGRTELRHDLAPGLPDSLRAQPARVDKKVARRLTRGKLKPEGRIDLHGMTLDRAHAALNRFVLEAHRSDKRLVLVITGKGKHRDADGPIPVRLGVLRHQVPEWLRLPPLAAVVLQVTPAHVRHGGEGAYYVYLRRARPSGSASR